MARVGAGARQRCVVPEKRLVRRRTARGDGQRTRGFRPVVYRVVERALHQRRLGARQHGQQEIAGGVDRTNDPRGHEWHGVEAAGQVLQHVAECVEDRTQRAGRGRRAKNVLVQEVDKVAEILDEADDLRRQSVAKHHRKDAAHDLRDNVGDGGKQHAQVHEDRVAGGLHVAHLVGHAVRDESHEQIEQLQHDLA